MQCPPHSELWLGGLTAASALSQLVLTLAVSRRLWLLHVGLQLLAAAWSLVFGLSHIHITLMSLVRHSRGEVFCLRFIGTCASLLQAIGLLLLVGDRVGMASYAMSHMKKPEPRNNRPFVFWIDLDKDQADVDVRMVLIMSVLSAAITISLASYLLYHPYPGRQYKPKTQSVVGTTGHWAYSGSVGSPNSESRNLLIRRGNSGTDLIAEQDISILRSTDYGNDNVQLRAYRPLGGHLLPMSEFQHSACDDSVFLTIERNTQEPLTTFRPFVFDTPIQEESAIVQGAGISHGPMTTFKPSTRQETTLLRELTAGITLRPTFLHHCPRKYNLPARFTSSSPVTLPSQELSGVFCSSRLPKLEGAFDKSTGEE